MTALRPAAAPADAATLAADVDDLLEQGELEAALARAERFIALQDDPDAYAAQAKVLARLRRFDEAHDALAAALRIDPRHAGAHFVLGGVHKKQNALPLAAACFEHVLEFEPGDAEASYELGYVYQELGRLEDARAQLEQAYAAAPEELRYANQLAYVLVRLDEFERGIALFERICARTSPAIVRPRINLSNALLRIGRFARALEVLEEILAVEPNNVEARWNRSLLLLGMGRYEEGWQDYDFRAMLKSRPARLLPFRQWEGEPLEGNRVLITAEQGLGDEIMFASCIPDVLNRAREVHIECEHRLAPLFARSFPSAIVWGSNHEGAPAWLSDLPDIDYWARGGSLLRFLRKGGEQFPAHEGYLRADEARTGHWRDRLAALGPGLKVGLSWRGGTAATRSSMRSLALAQLEPLLRCPGCRFVSLQYGAVGAELDAVRTGKALTIEHWCDAIDNYDETAALVCALDLVISVQTAIIHLSGALGKAAWVMLPAAPEWRYGMTGDRMPWYPSVRLFRQQAAGDWRGTLAAVELALRETLARPDALRVRTGI